MAKMGGPSAQGGMVRPVPNPMLNPQPAPAAAKPASSGLFPHMGIQQRFDMAMDLLKNGMQMGANSGSPLAAFLAPLAGAVIGGGIENKRSKLMGAENDALMASMLPGADQDELQRLSGIVNNPDAPDYLKSVAKARLDAAIQPYVSPASGAGGGGGGGSGAPKTRKPTSTDVLLSSMFADAIDASGDGGQEITAAEQARIDALKIARSKGTSAAEPAKPKPVIIDGYTIEQIE